MTVHETDICIIGGGITSAMLAERLSELRPGVRITVVEAGQSIFDAQNRGRYRQRAIDYGEHPWPGDYIEDQQADGIISMTMAVGGLFHCLAAGIRVPDDVGLFGFNGLDIGRALPQPLSTIRSNRFKIGQCAVQVLLDSPVRPYSPTSAATCAAIAANTAACGPSPGRPASDAMRSPMSSGTRPRKGTAIALASASAPPWPKGSLASPQCGHW